MLKSFPALDELSSSTVLNRMSILLATILLAIFIPQQGSAAVVGNIAPAEIEIDIPSADLQPNSGLPGFVDWVKDFNPNTDTPSLIDSIATGLIPGVSAAPGGAGHWHGVRIVDGIAGNDQNIFLTGGKENDVTTWNIGPGSVGSSKYDITQAYLANNNEKLFFGMERRGNNGTTAFDFEFNQLAPSPSSPLVPTRSVGDVLFTFEMSGSGSSGSATAHYYLWNGTSYVEQIPAPPSLISSINQTETAAAPWGYVNSKGNWVLGTLPRFTFAEASVALAEAFPGVELCNGPSAFVQVRTRSSSTDTSDLKDTTRIFEFVFGGPAPVVSLSTDCLGQLTFDATGSTDSAGGSNLSYAWDLIPPAGVTLSGSGITGPDGNGAYQATGISGTALVSFPAGVSSASVTVVLTVQEGTSCTSSKEATASVLAPLSASITQKTSDGQNMVVVLTGESPSATSLQWQIFSNGAWANIAGATSATLSYGSFEADAVPTVQNFNIDGTPYQGKLYQVQLRLTARRTSNGTVCDAASPALVIKKVVAVDP